MGLALVLFLEVCVLLTDCGESSHCFVQGVRKSVHWWDPVISTLALSTTFLLRGNAQSSSQFVLLPPLELSFARKLPYAECSTFSLQEVHSR